MKPALFLDLELDAARERANEEGRMLLVNVVAHESAECEEMDRTTWSDAEVARRIAESAIAIRIDIDADAFTARMVNIASTPGIAAQDQGGYVDQVEGPMTPAELLAWFDKIGLGKTYVERRRGEIARDPSDPFRRLQLASSLHQNGKLDEATTEYVWVWKHMVNREPKLSGMKHYSVAPSLKKLVDAHPPARATFAALRAESPPSLDVPDSEAFADWWSLNMILGEDAKTLAWFDEHRDRALATAWLEEDLVLRMEPLFMQADRWADVARLHEDAVEEFRAKVTLHAKMKEEMAMVASLSPPGAVPASTFAFTRLASEEQLRETAYKLVRALKAAGRDDEAKQIADAASAADSSAEMAAALGGRYTAKAPEELMALAAKAAAPTT